MKRPDRSLRPMQAWTVRQCFSVHDSGEVSPGERSNTQVLFKMEGAPLFECPFSLACFLIVHFPPQFIQSSTNLPNRNCLSLLCANGSSVKQVCYIVVHSSSRKQPAKHVIVKLNQFSKRKRINIPKVGLWTVWIMMTPCMVWFTWTVMFVFIWLIFIVVIMKHSCFLPFKGFMWTFKLDVELPMKTTHLLGNKLTSKAWRIIFLVKISNNTLNTWNTLIYTFKKGSQNRNSMLG